MKRLILLLALVMLLQGCAVVNAIGSTLDCVIDGGCRPSYKSVSAFCTARHLPDYPEAYDYCMQRKRVP